VNSGAALEHTGAEPGGIVVDGSACACATCAGAGVLPPDPSARPSPVPCATCAGSGWLALARTPAGVAVAILPSVGPGAARPPVTWAGSWPAYRAAELAAGRAPVYDAWRAARPRGPGSWRLGADVASYGRAWIHVDPTGNASHVRLYTGTTPEPPPLRKPGATACGCSEGSHACPACGEPAWIEIHGYADGYCSACYARG